MAQSVYDVIIVGAGLAGLTAAKLLTECGLQCLVLEASNSVGGRVKTDEQEGFLLDRGFQVLLSAYPEARALLDYDKLQLKSFFNGALVRTSNGMSRVADPWRHPIEGVQSIYNKVGDFRDKLKVGEMRQKMLTRSSDAYQDAPESTTLAYLQKFGFSESMINLFFRPFLGGIFLESKLNTSSRFLEFVFRNFSMGDIVLPAKGMQSIPRQLAEAIPLENFRFNTRVKSIAPGYVWLESGEVLRSKTVLVATDAQDAQGLLPDVPGRSFNEAHCLYFATEKPPVTEPILVLNAYRGAFINNLCVPSLVSPTYAPVGQHLVSVSVLENSLDQEQLHHAVLGELRDWFGPEVDTWRHLRTYHIRRALPSATLPDHPLTLQSCQLAEGVFRCGDYLDTPSINGAMASGRRAAEAILAELGIEQPALKKPVGAGRF